MRQKGKGFLSIILAVIMVLGSASNLPLAGVFADGPSPGSASYQNEAAGPSPAVEGGQGEEAASSPAVEGGQGEEAGPSWGLYRLAADEPANESGVYQIGTAAHLVWLAEEVNGGRPDVSAKLAADIDLDPIPEWAPIGSTPGNSFSGTFDGGGHKISRLSVTNDSYRGLFGYIGAGGTVKNLTISDSSVVGAGHLGLVAGSNAGTISGIAVEDSEVATLAKQTNLGGIAGINSGTVTACANISAAVTQTEAADGSSAGTGGIVGANTGTVSFSFNKAEVKNGNNDNYNGFNAGIAGFNGIGGTIASCYNAGKIGMAYRSGGIAGANSGTIANSYNIGTVNEGGYAGRGGGISVTGTASNVTNSYYLDSSIVSSANFGTAKTEAELKAMAADLGGAFDNDLAPQINGGYPVLKWQNPSAEYGVSLTAKPAGAEVSFGPGGGPAIAPDSSAGGVYTFKALPRGSYEYAVSEDGGDYVRQAGAIDISYSDVNMVIELERRLYPVEFSVSPQDATVSITEEGYEQSKSAAGGSASFELPMGAYTYAVDRFGFIGQTGTVTVAKGDGAGTVTKVLAESEKHNVTFAVNVPEAIVTVTHPADGVQAPASANSYNLYVGNTYSYTVKCKGYVTQTGTATIGGSDESIQITLLEGITAWDGESKSEPALVDGVYQIFDAEELAWFRDKANSQLKLGSGSNAANIANNSTSSNISAILRSDIDLGGCEWLPIGTYVNDQSSYWGVPYGYAGTFDGNGHAIRGLSITTGANGSGLFGCVFAGTVKNLTVAGSVFGGQYSGGIAGIAYGGGSTSSLTPAPATGSTISNCANYVDVSTGRSGANAFIGGIAGSIGNHGYSKEAGLIEYCTNYGTVNGGETNSYIGGIVGDGAYGVSVRNCGNEGAVSGLGNVGGIAGDSAIPISGCYNAGAITGADAASSSASRTGGIAGGSANAIENSYNTGAVAGKTDIGGIVGLLKNTSADSAAAVRNSYNAGAISKPGGASATSGAIAGGKSGAYKAVFNTYYLDTAAANGIGSNAHAEDSAVSKTAAELKGADVLEALGSQFGSDLPTPVNGGYPILKWQGAEAADTAVDIDAIGLSAPATGAPAQTAVSTPQYTGTVSWAPALPPNGSFAAEVAYTATIALTARDGYTFDGVPADFFKVDGAATVSNAAGSGEVTAVFPATRALAGITVKLRAQSGFEFLYTSENLAVAEGLAAQYGFSNAAAVPPGTITALDALVAAHAARYGAAFTAETAAGYLTMNGGSPQAFFGNNETGKYSGFAINHAYPMISGAGYTVNEAPVSEGDVIDFFYYEDASWMDYLTWFADAAGNAVDSLTVDQGEEFTLKIKGFMYMGGYASPPPEDIYNEGEGMLQVFAAGDEGNILGDVRSAAGITLSFDEAGVYRLTAQGFENDNDALIVPPFIVVNVVEGGAPADAPVSISAIPGIGSPAYGKTAPISMVTAQYTGTVAWSPAIPAGGSFAADTAYTATITLAARPGYTFEGVAADFFTVDGLRGENAAGSGTVTVAFPATGPAPQQPADAAEARGGALGYLKAAVSAPTFADIGGEWTIIALARSGYTDTVYYDGYYSRVLAAIAGREAKLDADKSTENSRLILALTSLGIDAASVGGKDLVAPLLSDMAWVTKQGINGAIYALLAVDSGGYAQTGAQADAQADVQTGAQAGRQADAQASVQADAQAGAQADTRADAQMGVQADTQTGAQALVDHIVNNKAGAGWALAGQVPAVDITAMAIQALAPHYEQPAVKAAVDSALGWLAAQDVIGAGANAQVIVALSALGEDAANYNGKDYVAALLSYYNPESGGFVYNSAAPNIMATEQAAYALVAYDRYKTSGANSLYDMGDAAKLVSDDVAPAKTDKSALAAKIAEAEGYSQGSYTAASWGILSAALANARTVYNNDNAAQGEIDAAVHGLAAAIGTLTPLGSGGSEPKYVQISVTDPNAGAGQKKEYHPLTRYEMNNNETAYTLLLRTGLNVKISTQSGYEGVYVVSIDGWGELSDGPSSGWMYSVNGEFTEVSSSLNKLKEGDVVRWVYTRNLGNDVGGGSSTGTGSAPSGGTSKVISATPAINGGTATSTVSDTQVADAIKAVLADLEGRGADAVGEVKISLDTKDAVKAVAGFTGKALKSVAKEGKVALTVETGVGALTFDSAALSAISSALSDGAKAEISISRMGGPAGGSNSSLASTLTEGQRAIVGDNPVFELSVMIDGGLVTDFGNGTVRAVLPYTPKAGEDTGRLTIYHMADDGAVTEMKGAKYDEGLGGVVFTTGHFSLFFIAAADAGLENLFNDVAAADWFYSAVKYAYENGLMNGTAAGTFSPHAKLSRAMIVRILHNIEGTEGTPAEAGGAPAEGTPAAVADGADAAAGTAGTVAEGSPAAVAEGSAEAGGAAFGDVPAGLWYSDAVAWAAANGIVTGYGNGAFGPNDDISREQLATILYNYANWKKMDTSKAAELSGYADADGISGWALNAMKWANAQGLITGRTPTELAPAGTATRAEAAAIFQRFMEGAKK